MKTLKLVMMLLLLPCAALAQEPETRAEPVPIQVERTASGWKYAPRGGYVILKQLGKSTANSRFQVCGSNVVVHTGLGKAKPESTNACEIVALSLPKGNVVYRRPSALRGYPFDVQGIWPWADSAVAWGHCPQYRSHVVAILDADGKLARSFAIGALMRPLTVDKHNNSIICLEQRESVTGAQPREDQMPPQHLHTLKLPNGSRGAYMPIRLLVDAICDGDGNVYIIRFVEGLNRSKIERMSALRAYDILLEKYIASTWEKVWSVRIDREKNKGSWPWVMVKPEGDTIWFAAQNPLFHKKWTGRAYHAQTGQLIREDPEFSPFRHTVKTKDAGYVVELDQKGRDNCIRVTKEKTDANKRIEATK
jgi:hypothetical protein